MMRLDQKTCHQCLYSSSWGGCDMCCDCPLNSCWDISLKASNVSLHVCTTGKIRGWKNTLGLIIQMSTCWLLCLATSTAKTALQADRPCWGVSSNWEWRIWGEKSWKGGKLNPYSFMFFLCSVEELWSEWEFRTCFPKDKKTEVI